MSPRQPSPAVSARCDAMRSSFSPYLDGAVTGVEMAALSDHLEACAPCSSEFAGLRALQQSLGRLGAARPPARLQARLRAAIALERERNAHLPFSRRALLLWQTSLAPLALRVSGGLAAALVLAGGLTWMFAGLGAVVQASDDRMTHMVAPRYLYSQVPAQAIQTSHDAPIIVEASVDDSGRVYDYDILEGPHDPAVRVRVEDNLLASVFQPATVFGIPVRGHVLLTYSGVSVHN